MKDRQYVTYDGRPRRARQEDPMTSQDAEIYGGLTVVIWVLSALIVATVFILIIEAITGG